MLQSATDEAKVLIKYLNFSTDVTTKMTNNNLNKKVEQIYDVYFKNTSQMFYHEDKHLNNRSLVDIFNYFSNIQRPCMEGAHYSELEKITEKKGSLIYKFKVIPGHDSIAIKNNHSTEHFHYKIIPKLKLVDGDKK